MSQEKVYSEAEIKAKLAAELPAWEFREGWIRRTYKTAGWPWTMMLVNAIGFVAEAAFHHPDLSVSWAMVTVKLSTHSAKGVTDKDFELAREIDRVALWQPGEGAALEGFEKGFKKKWVH
jgi:4a-hydroxytetrahydrobiopterin dehydratase